MLSIVYIAALAQIAYKLFFMKQKKLFLVMSLTLFCCIPLLSYLALKKLDLSTVYISTGITYVLVLILARFILNETIDKQHIYAVVLIISGVLVFNI